MLEKWFEAIQANLKKAEAAGDPIGACFLPDPTGGVSICVQLDEATCKALKGVFAGGACPGLESAHSEDDANPKVASQRVGLATQTEIKRRSNTL